MGLGSEIRDPEKTYSGSRIQGSKSTGSRIPDPESRIPHPDPQYRMCVPVIDSSIPDL
jgi:hypothetical protein